MTAPPTSTPRGMASEYRPTSNHEMCTLGMSMRPNSHWSTTSINRTYASSDAQGGAGDAVTPDCSELARSPAQLGSTGIPVSPAGHCPNV